MAGTQKDSQGGQGKAVETDGSPCRKELCGEGYAGGCPFPEGGMLAKAAGG